MADADSEKNKAAAPEQRAAAAVSQNDSIPQTSLLCDEAFAEGDAGSCARKRFFGSLGGVSYAALGSLGGVSYAALGSLGEVSHADLGSLGRVSYAALRSLGGASHAALGSLGGLLHAVLGSLGEV